MRMVEARGELRLPHESLTEALVLGELRGEELQRNALPSPRVRRQVDGARCPRPMSDSTRKPARMVRCRRSTASLRSLALASRIYQRRQEAVPSTASCCAPELTEAAEPGSARSSAGACGATRASDGDRAGSPASSSRGARPSASRASAQSAARRQAGGCCRCRGRACRSLPASRWRPTFAASVSSRSWCRPGSRSSVRARQAGGKRSATSLRQAPARPKPAAPWHRKPLRAAVVWWSSPSELDPYSPRLPSASRSPEQRSRPIGRPTTNGSPRRGADEADRREVESRHRLPGGGGSRSSR